MLGSKKCLIMDWRWEEGVIDFRMATPTKNHHPEVDFETK